MPTPQPLLDEATITGAFRLDVTARFDDLIGGSWQRVFDFGNGPASNNILLTQVENSNDIAFEFFQSGERYEVVAENAIEEGEVAEWSVGIDDNGLMWLEKDGLRLGESQAVVPDDSVRSNLLIGESNWQGDATLNGAVLGLNVTQGTEPDTTDLGISDTVEDGPFELSALIHFASVPNDDPQTLFTATGDTEGDDLSVTRVGEDVIFSVTRGGVQTDLVADGAIEPDSFDDWTFGIDDAGVMWIERGGERIEEGPSGAESSFAVSSFTIADPLAPAPFDGSILDLTIAAPGGLVPMDEGIADPGGDPEGDDGDDPTGGQVDDLVDDPIEDGGSDPTDGSGSDPENPSDGDETDEGSEPEPETETGTETGGVFQIAATVRFDDLQSAGWQRVFDFGDGPGTNNILLSQIDVSPSMAFQIWQDGVPHTLVAHGAIVEGETAEWRVGVDEDGLMWMERDGVRLAEGQGIVPDVEVRANMLIGESNWPGDSPLIGEVLDLDLSPEAADDVPDIPVDPVDPSEDDPEDPPSDDPVDPPDPVDPVDPNEDDPEDPPSDDPVDPVDPSDPVDPADPVDSGGSDDPVDPGDPGDGETPSDPEGVQTGGAFRVDAVVRFDDLDEAYWQRVFDFGDGPSSNNLLLSQVENTSTMTFAIYENTQVYRVDAENAIVEGETASWSAGVDDDGTMWIEKDGARVAEGNGVVPQVAVRENMLIGESNWPDDTPITGEVSFLALNDNTLHGEPPLADDPNDTPDDPIDPVDPVDSEEPDDPIDPEEPDDPTDPEDPVDSVDPNAPVDPFPGGDVFVVAHPDDDLLFMNPTILTQIQGEESVAVVYLTSGDAGFDEERWGAREDGLKAAYSVMTGETDWVDETITIPTEDDEFDVSSSYLASAPDVRLYFLRIPDGFDGGGSPTYEFSSLERLWLGEIEETGTVDDTNVYTAETLTEVLTGIYEREGPSQLHVQDTSDLSLPTEHSDHDHGSFFAEAALNDYDESVTVTSHLGYITWSYEENIEEDLLIQVQDAFAAYAAFDPHVAGPDGEINEPYDEWLLREVIASQHVHEATPAEEDPLAVLMANGPDTSFDLEEGPEEPEDLESDLLGAV